MNTPGIIQEIGAAAAASPVCCRLLEVSIEVAVLALAVWGLIHLLRIRSARVCSLLWILVLAKGLLGLAFGAPFELAGLRVAAFSGAGQSVAAAGMTQEESALRDEEIRRALSEMESLSTTAAGSPQTAAGAKKALSPAQAAASQRDRGASARWFTCTKVLTRDRRSQTGSPATPYTTPEVPAVAATSPGWRTLSDRALLGWSPLR